jgi:molybdenum cofactor synthesis domain-containing protein
METAVILSVGREILRGRVHDSNSWMLARRLTSLGVRLLRLVACDDDPSDIAREVRRAREDGATLIVTTGGLGPTDDDLTLAALAEATGRPLVLDEEARRLVAGRYAGLHQAGAVDEAGMTPAREKMARIPQGSRALPNPVGAAPAVWLEVGRMTLVALPGVPAETAAILEASVLPALAARTPGTVYLERAVTTQARDESQVAPILRRIAQELPDVFLKSHATRFGTDVRMEVFASTWAGGQSIAEERLARALALVREALGEAPTES